MGGDHSLDALTYMGMKVMTSPYVPDGQVLVVDGKAIGNLKTLGVTMQNTASTAEHASRAMQDMGKGLAGLSADFVIMDEWADIEAAYLGKIADGNKGVLRRAALKEIERREREQAELEAVPGFASF
jgi:hypothetical protein